jgi:hypothetical protein
MAPIRKEAERPLAHDMSAIKRFNSYKAESEKQVRSPAPAKDKAMEAILSCWNAFKFRVPDAPDQEADFPEEYYECVSGHLKGRDTKYCAKDVEKFSIALAELPRVNDSFEGKAGLFLSALIDCCKAARFTIHTENLTHPLDFLGFRNRKTIVVEGDVGDFLGCEMSGGKITVKGDAGYEAGQRMGGGEIHIEGEIKDGIADEDDVCEGKIFHRGELISKTDEDY